MSSPSTDRQRNGRSIELLDGKLFVLQVRVNHDTLKKLLEELNEED